MRTYFHRYQVAALAALLLAAALAMSACTSSPTPEPATATPPPTADTSQSPTSMPEPTEATEPLMLSLPLDFPIETYSGDDYAAGTELMFSDFFADGKPVILNFWAGLCPPCRAEMPDFQEFEDEYSDRVTLVGVDIGQYLLLGNREDAEALLDDLGVTYPTGLTSEDVIRDYMVLGMPTTVFMNPDGTVFRNWNGILTREQLNDRADELLMAQQ